jgi:hypothetical protein
MELYERPTLKNVYFLNTMDFKTFKTYASNCKNDEERKQKFDRMKSYCEAMIKSKGEIKKNYSYTEVTPIEVGGRLYCGNSVQGLQKDMRGLLFRECTTDIDMKNAHPVILRYLCKIHNIPCPNLSWYIDHREEVLIEMGKGAKELFLKAVNDDKLNKKVSNSFFKDFDKECKSIQEQLTKLSCYSHIVDTVPQNKLYNKIGSAINRILCVFENKILQEAHHICNKNRLETCALMFDGLMIYGNHYENQSLLDEINCQVNSVFEGLNMTFVCKEHSALIQVPENFEMKKEVKEDLLIKDFKNVCEEFEKTHCKIINKGFFIKQEDNKNIVMTKTHLITSYEHITYQKIIKDNVVECNFINDWFKNNPLIRRYDDIECFPDESKCPTNVFNTWRPFAMELVTDYKPNQEALQMMRNHIKILCNNDDKAAIYMEAWIAQMIQFPAVKSICPTIISKQGAGKGTLLKLISAMIGDDKYFETTTPSRDVWGDFNGRMANTFLVNLDELSRKESLECEGKIKGLITNPHMTINEKGVGQYKIISYHRFIGTTNHEDPLKTEKDDRRNWIIRASDELIGKVEYFKQINEYIEDVNVIKTCYEYFKSIPDMINFNKLQMPVSEYQQEMKEMNTSPIESWMKSFVLDHYYEDEIELLGQKLYDLFNEWCKKCNIDYKITIQAFGVRMKRLNISGIERGKHTNKGETKIFIIQKLRDHFKINDISVDNTDEELE